MSDQVVKSDVPDPADFRARQNATALMAQIENKIHELSNMLDKVSGPQRLLIRAEVVQQKWHHDMIRAECRKKGWL